MRRLEPKILASARHRRMPWKNGGGETVEVAVFPEDSDLADFGWRVSMATVASDGPFSLFPGIDRTLALLSGQGMELEIEGTGWHLLMPECTPLAFPADVPTSARLTGGAITDLNVMTRRGLFRHTLRRIRPGSGSKLDTAHDWTLVLAFADLEIVAAGTLFRLAPLDVLLMEGRREAAIDRPGGDAYLIGIDRL
ncbi:HutD family protein [Rhizobium sp. TRM96647]|uniref:HutD/Ves family protein n=1 Tax=unclassified Rhizobium TaxID=2613769 RepID=UPI0021E6D7AB|nr:MULTISPECIES: HutD family protein [unclassified Rhizobium]MCV3738261.1 HutD family protein [Rhizobium sp. TRM96647]MCV3759990.1 HutD family protein [Rhizobium sp. TRM96650]